MTDPRRLERDLKELARKGTQAEERQPQRARELAWAVAPGPWKVSRPARQALASTRPLSKL